MKESIEKRIELIKNAEDSEALKKCLCPFFSKGGSPECISCRQSDVDLDECKDYYLERIISVPLDIWDSSFDAFTVQKRENKIAIKDVVGIGVNCSSCYMYDKCPMYKKGYECGLEWGASKPKSPEEFYEFLIDVQYERVRRASVFEKIDGGVPDANLSGEMDRLSGLVSTKADLSRERLSISVEASGAASGSGGGILSKLFGGGGGVKEISAPATIAIDKESESRKGIGEVTEFEEVKEPVRVPRKSKTKE